MTLFTLLISTALIIKTNQASQQKFILYDTNPGEGFNLRRDVYIRIANLVKGLNEVEERESTDVEYRVVLQKCHENVPKWLKMAKK